MTIVRNRTGQFSKSSVDSRKQRARERASKLNQKPVVACDRAEVRVPNFGCMSGSEDRGGGDNSIQFINIRRVGDKSFKEWRQKIGGWKGG